LAEQHHNPTNTTATMAPPKKGWHTKEEREVLGYIVILQANQEERAAKTERQFGK
jgi:hypothetical protein